jgi:putative FmdB family regulatory protein
VHKTSKITLEKPLDALKFLTVSVLSVDLITGANMPIYEYSCTACGHELEALQKMNDAPLITCPSCSQETLKKLISAAGFHLKGNGWYATDFKGNSSKPEPTCGTGQCGACPSAPDA